MFNQYGDLLNIEELYAILAISKNAVYEILRKSWLKK